MTRDLLRQHPVWLPRTVFLPRIISRATLSTTADQPPTQRSASRFSLKIAQYLYSNSRLQQGSSTPVAPLTTHAYYAKNESVQDAHQLARSFLLSLEPDHRRILRNQLTEIESATNTAGAAAAAAFILPSQLAVVFIETGLPYIGFGFVDNFVMLVAGETIETFFGAAFCLSTMAAAGLGNAVSDVMGIGLADRIERISGRFLAVFGIISPKLTSAQWRLPSVRKTQLMSKVICIFLGCLLGMCPLLFRDTSASNGKSTRNETT